MGVTVFRQFGIALASDSRRVTRLSNSSFSTNLFREIWFRSVLSIENVVIHGAPARVGESSGHFRKPNETLPRWSVRPEPNTG